MITARVIVRMFIAGLLAALLYDAAAAGETAPTKSRLRLDQAKYHAGDCLMVSVADAARNTKPVVERVTIGIGDFYPKGAATGDLEVLTLVETGGDTGVFQSQKCLPVRHRPAKRHDGVLEVNPGDVIAALYQDPDNSSAPKTAAELDLSIDLALISGGKGKGLFQFSVDPAILPKDLAGTPGKLPGESVRPLAMVLDPDEVPLIYGEDQIVYLPKNDQDLANFLAAVKGKVVDELDLPASDPQQAGQMLRYYVIRIDPAQEDLDDFAYLMELAGLRGRYTFSSESAAKLAALLVEEQLGGSFVTPNYLMQPLSVPVTREGDLDGNGAGGDDGFGASWIADTDVNLHKAIVYLDMIDRDRAGSVNTAIIDVGFAGPGDYPPGDPLAGLSNPDYGLPFAMIPQGDCFGTPDCSGSAGGPNPVPCLTGACRWHGTQVFSVAGAVANNNSGAIGIAGHGRDGSGQDGTRGVINPMLFKISFPYITDVARAVNAATGRAAQVINISSGFFCTPLTGGITAGVHTNLCSGADRAEMIFLCLIIPPILDGFIGIAGGGIIPPAVGELLSSLGCAALLAVFDIAGVYDYDALVVALRNARNSGVVLVASGPETGGGFGPFDAHRVRMVPCTLVGLCVGAIDGGKGPAGINPLGGGIDIWAPGDTFTTTPLPGSGGGITSFAGTSAAAPFITGVVALMKAANPSLTPEEIETLLKDRSNPLTSGPSLPCETRPSDPTSCVGFVDAYAAVRAAAGTDLICDGWDEALTPPDDIPATATSFGFLRGPGSGAARGINIGIHALSSRPDEDWYQFRQTPIPGSLTTDLTIYLAFMPAYGSLAAQLFVDNDSDPDNPPVPLFVGALSGGPAGLWAELAYRGLFFTDRLYFIRVFAPSPAGINDNCHDNYPKIWVNAAGPAADSFEGGGGNDAPDRASALSADGWDHRHFDPLVVADYAGPGSIVFSSQEYWGMRVTGLNLDSRTDIDYFRVPVPDPADPADGGHEDINPDARITEPLPECGVVERTGISPPVGSGTDHIIFTGVLTVTARPSTPAPGEMLNRFNVANSGTSLSRTIVCPRSISGVNEIIFSFGERFDERIVGVAYGLDLEYKIDIERVPGIADWILGERDARGAGAAGGMPCPGGFFPSCPADPDGRMRFGLEHPLDSGRGPGCKADGCPEFFIFNWPSAGSFDMIFSSAADLTYELFDASRILIGEAAPIAGTADPGLPLVPLHLAFVAGASDPADPVKRLFIPQLAPGLYVLVVRGPEDVYTADALKPHAVNHAPVADAGPDQAANATSPEGAFVTLNGSDSSDPDGDPLTFTWTGFFGAASGPSPTVLLPVGVHMITLTVTDPAGGAGIDTVRMTVKGASDQIRDLAGLVRNFKLNPGVEQSLVAKLEGALKALADAEAGPGVCNMLLAFIHEAQAQSGKMLSVEQARWLSVSAGQIRTVLGCL